MRRPRTAFLLLLAAVSWLACGGSSPTDPAPTGPTSDVVLLDPAGALDDHREAVLELIGETLDRIRPLLAFDPVTVTVTADAARSIPGWGLGGYAPGPRNIEIVLDPDFPGLGAVLGARLPPIVAHEIHHAVRWRDPGYGTTLLGALISEGLADHFAVELLGGPTPPWTRAFPRVQTELYLALACEELDSTAYNFDHWFLRGNGELPPWTGYTLGYRIVEEHQDAGGASAAELVDASPELLRPACPE